MDNKELLENLIELYGNDVLRIATLYTKNPNIAEDIFQDVFIKVSKYISSFKKESSEKTWIIKITINTCKDYLKSAWKKKIVPLENFNEINPINTSQTDLTTSETSNLIIKEILSLSPKYKDVIILYYYKDFNTLEISKILNIPEATIRTRLKRGRALLKEKLKIVLED